MQRFHDHEADVLLGTQMVAKGLDFEKVELVGVVLADVGLTLPDFRSEERVFQLMTQVSGRAGRRKNQGRIVIQTYRPKEPLFQYLRKNDTAGFISDQMCRRKETGMSPFGVTSKITFSDIAKEKAHHIAHGFFKSMKSKIAELEKSVDKKVDQASEASEMYEVHFAPAFFPRTHGKFHFHVFLRATHQKQLYDLLQKVEVPEGARIDMSPVTLL